MVEDQGMGISQVFGGLDIVADGGWIGSDFRLGKHDTDLH
jgi:hypothetical protein